MFKFLFAAAFLTLIGFMPAPADAACPAPCNRGTDGVDWVGDPNHTFRDPIQVTVCHGYWHLLDVGTYRGQQTRWWEPTMVYNSWGKKVPTVVAECKTYTVERGTEMWVYADCVKRVIETGRMTRSGTYTLT